MKFKIATYELYALAVLGFIMDHVGLYFWDDNLWLRAERPFTLAWFFPIGYNSARKPSLLIWIGLIAMTLGDRLAGFNILPLCVLANIILIRWVINPLMEFAIKSRLRFWLVNILLLELTFPTNEFVDYGTMGLIIAISGWLLRNKDSIRPEVVQLRSYFIYMTVVYVIFTQLVFYFSPAQFAVVVAGSCFMSYILYHFRDVLRETISRKKTTGPVDALCRFIGHKSLEIYVIHHLLIRAVFVWILMGK